MVTSYYEYAEKINCRWPFHEHCAKNIDTNDFISSECVTCIGVSLISIHWNVRYLGRCVSIALRILNPFTIFWNECVTHCNWITIYQKIVSTFMVRVKESSRIPQICRFQNWKFPQISFVRRINLRIKYVIVV